MQSFQPKLIHVITVLVVTLCLCAFQVHAADAPGSAAARHSLRSLVPDTRAPDLHASALPGYFDTVVDGKVVYVSADGKYMVQGEVYNFDGKSDISAARLATQRKDVLAQIPAKNEIIFSPKNPRYSVTVFTDVECPYCRKFHDQIADYLKAGIEVRYVVFPLNIHPESHRKSIALWCEADHQSAFTSAMEGVDPGSKQCPNPIQANLLAGQAVGMNGTPAIFGADGTQLGGYITPDALLARLRAGDPVAAALAAKESASH